MNRLLRPLAIFFLRQTARGPLVAALPESESAAALTMPRTFFPRLVGRITQIVGRIGGKLMTAEHKASVQDWLINRFRIPVNWQPRAALEACYRAALERLSEAAGPESLGEYLEFGVYQGNSLICMHRALAATGLDQMRLFGFDSFAGLPETAALDEVWSPGQFRADLDFTRELLSNAGIDWSRTELIPGFFSATLTDELKARHRLHKASVIMIDCDLYTSTCEALTFCAPLIQDQAVILFDDWHSTDEAHGEKRAFSEFLHQHPEFSTTPLDAYQANAAVFLLERQP